MNRAWLQIALGSVFTGIVLVLVSYAIERHVRYVDATVTACPVCPAFETVSLKSSDRGFPWVYIVNSTSPRLSEYQVEELNAHMVMRWQWFFADVAVYSAITASVLSLIKLLNSKTKRSVTKSTSRSEHE